MSTNETSQQGQTDPIVKPGNAQLAKSTDPIVKPTQESKASPNTDPIVKP